MVYRLYNPSEILDSRAFPHRLASRLLPEQRARLSEDLDEEAALLRRFIENNQLDEWLSWMVKTLKDQASKTI